MQINVEVLDGLSRKLIVTVPEDGIQQEIDKRLKEMAQRAKLPGFRAGKVPVTVVKQQFGETIRHEVLSEILQKTYREALEKENLFPANLPTMRFLSQGVSSPLTYEAVFEVYPTIETIKTEGLILEQYQVEVNDEDVEDMLQRLAKQQIEWLPVSRPAQLGDQVLIDFEGYIHGEVFEGSAGKQALLELGSGFAIPGFEEGLIGVCAEEEKILHLQFPENYARTELSGKPVEITVKVFKVNEAKKPSFDDAFAEKFGVKEGGMEALRQQMRENMSRDSKEIAKNQSRTQLIDQFIALNPIEVPKSLIEDEAKKLKYQTEQQIRRINPNHPIQEQPIDQFMPSAAQRVKLGLLFREYVRIHGLKADPAKVEELLGKLTGHDENSPTKEGLSRLKRERALAIQNMVLEEQIMETLTKAATIENKTMSYGEFNRHYLVGR